MVILVNREALFGAYRSTVVLCINLFVLKFDIYLLLLLLRLLSKDDDVDH
jgi:hypothetical protein